MVKEHYIDRLIEHFELQAQLARQRYDRSTFSEDRMYYRGLVAAYSHALRQLLQTKDALSLRSGL